MVARRLVVSGQVQGVGFRPFVYRLAHRHALTGWVRNRVGVVEIHVEGDATALAAFTAGLLEDAPAIARPRLDGTQVTEPAGHTDFEILPSEAGDRPSIHIPPDYFTCDDCLAELRDPSERRHHYPFINCTQCGPRYTIIESLPYDRPNTSMAGFPLCTDCAAEYGNPLDRRFHAQPLACPVCGPSLEYHAGATTITDSTAALSATVEALRDGLLVAVKGIGGYHLVCDAANQAAVESLRMRKPRPHKPLAVMFPVRGADELDAVREIAELSPAEAALLRSPARPIVLGLIKDGILAPSIAPGLREIGIMLPYSPLHHLLLHHLDRPLVATSANISGEPVMTRNDEIEARLGHVVDAFLHHDRAIVRPADDSVFRTIAGRPRPLRVGRGHAPLEIDLPVRLPAPLLAVGSHMKNTVALAWENRLVVSPHIGDLGSRRSQEVFERVIADLQSLYQVEAGLVVCDAHPGYASSRWARSCGLPLTEVAHHLAHASAVWLEHPDDGDWLVFTWDGVGYGSDGTLWGGEALHGRPGRWQRVASMRPFRLPGGEKAGREPWRSAAALCWESGYDWSSLPAGSDLLRQAWARGLNCPVTTAVGRLFDAAAALTGVCRTASYEGQGPMLLEQASTTLPAAPALPLHNNDAGIIEADWQHLLPELLDDSTPAGRRAAQFHARMARTVLAMAEQVALRHPFSRVGLAGGVFQNRLLTDHVVDLLAERGYPCHLGVRLPANDGAIAAGQVVEFAYQPR